MMSQVTTHRGTEVLREALSGYDTLRHRDTERSCTFLGASVSQCVVMSGGAYKAGLGFETCDL